MIHTNDIVDDSLFKFTVLHHSCYFLKPIFSLPSIQWCVLIPVVLTLIANQGKEDKYGKMLRGFCYPTWALEAFLIANAQRSVHSTLLNIMDG